MYKNFSLAPAGFCANNEWVSACCEETINLGANIQRPSLGHLYNTYLFEPPTAYTLLSSLKFHKWGPFLFLISSSALDSIPCWSWGNETKQ